MELTRLKTKTRCSLFELTIYEKPQNLSAQLMSWLVEGKKIASSQVTVIGSRKGTGTISQDTECRHVVAIYQYAGPSDSAGQCREVVLLITGAV